LMIEHPEKFVGDFAAAGSTYQIIHAETAGDLPRTLSLIREKGSKPGLVVNPATSEEVLKPHLSQTDLVLFMSVVPGFAGQSFMPEVVSKVARFAKWARANGYKGEIAVDGGITPKTSPALLEAGATMLVAATAIFKAPDMAAAIDALKNPKI